MICGLVWPWHIDRFWHQVVVGHKVERDVMFVLWCGPILYFHSMPVCYDMEENHLLYWNSYHVALMMTQINSKNIFLLTYNYNPRLMVCFGDTANVWLVRKKINIISAIKVPYFSKYNSTIDRYIFIDDGKFMQTHASLNEQYDIYMSVFSIIMFTYIF